MSADEITATLAGKTVYASTSNFVGYYTPDGEMRGKQGTEYDQGIWSVTEDNEICSEWNIWRGGKRHCARLFISETDPSKVKRVRANGRVDEGRLEVGNTEGLQATAPLPDFDGRWVLEFTNGSVTDRRIVEIKDNKFTTKVSTNGWRGTVAGDINKYGTLVGQGTMSQIGALSNNITTIHFTSHYRSGGFQEEVEAPHRAPVFFTIKLTRDERVEALSELE
jgi:hypothetical protein